MCSQTLETRLNDIVHVHIQSNGIEYVCNNYMSIREEYYNNKERLLGNYNNNKGDDIVCSS